MNPYTASDRKALNDRIVVWIREKVEREYAEDVSLVVLYGSYINGTGNRLSDVDCYFIPAAERAYQLSTGFIIEGVGYDLFPISWERAEDIADMQESLTPLIGDAQILYARSDEDLQRFRGLQARLQEHLADPAYCREIVQGIMEKAGAVCGELKKARTSSRIRGLSGWITMWAADAVATHHGDYYHFGLKTQYADLCSRFADLPEEIPAGYDAVVRSLSDEAFRANALAFFEAVSQYLDISVEIPEADEEPEPQTYPLQADALAGHYEEISSTFNKITICCETDNAPLAYISAVCLDYALNVEANELGFPVTPLLDAYDHRDLSKLAERAKAIEASLTSLIASGGGTLHKYDSFEAFAETHMK